METSKPLMKNESAEDVDVHLYRSMIGALMYLTSSRPNIIYLKGQPKLCLWYPKDSPFDLEAYTDSNYAGARTDNQEKDEKQSQNDKTGLGMEKTVKDKAKSKPESQSSQKVNRKVNWSKSKSTPGPKSKKYKFRG
ncbi:hypothetical protein Tco_0943381 [Tanacetum coccineum]